MYKKVLSCVLSLIICALALAGCKTGVTEPTATAGNNVTAAPTTTQGPADIDPKTVSYTTDVWKAIDMSYTSDTTYTDPFNDVTFDMIFKSPSGQEMKVPGFWDGGSVWKVRFAPTSYGVWSYTTVCSDTTNSKLHGRTGKIGANMYKGDLDIYKHGFIKTEPNVRYFMYADGTPFFYMGDTHWNMPAQPFDKSVIAGIDSQFKYIVDERASQGFTVYQSEPIGAKYTLSDGSVSEKDVAGFQDLDNRFKYIASKGLVHANAELFFAAELGSAGANYSDAYLEKLCRYWAARFSALPVMWTTAQEVDNDFYHGRKNENGGDSNPYYDTTTNPWKKVAEWVHKYDAYKQPLTGHQEYANINLKDPSDGTVASTSSFRDVPGHTWYGAQWTPTASGAVNFAIPKDFWENGQGKPVVNYEGSYDHLWTLEEGAREQGWTAYLNGMFGQGYGAEDIWLYNSTYNMDVDTKRTRWTVTIEDKKVKWYTSIHFPAATQLGTYMKGFFKNMEWWKLVPCFDDKEAKRISMISGTWYSAATIDNQTYVAYFYNATKATGKFVGLESGKTYTAYWFNPRTGIYTEIANDVTGTGEKSFWKIPDKADEKDWVAYLTINK